MIGGGRMREKKHREETAERSKNKKGKQEN